MAAGGQDGRGVSTGALRSIRRAGASENGDERDADEHDPRRSAHRRRLRGLVAAAVGVHGHGEAFDAEVDDRHVAAAPHREVVGPLDLAPDAPARIADVLVP